MSYGIELTRSAGSSLNAIPNSTFAEVDKAILTLSAFPERGRLYEPLYDAARPPMPLRVLYVRNYGIYYSVDHTKKLVIIRFIEDQRMDPKMR